jgi:hypothetical protein
MAQLPDDIEDILKCAAGEEAALAAAAHAADTRPVVVESACRWFIRHVLFRTGANYYWNLAVPREASLALVRMHYRHLISIFEAAWYEEFAKRLNEAYNCLKNPQMRARYDGTLSNQQPEFRSAPSRLRPRFARAGQVAGRSEGASAIADWVGSRRPIALKAMALGAVVLLAIGGVLVTRLHGGPSRDIALPDQFPSPGLNAQADGPLADAITKVSGEPREGSDENALGRLPSKPRDKAADDKPGILASEPERPPAPRNSSSGTSPESVPTSSTKPPFPASGSVDHPPKTDTRDFEVPRSQQSPNISIPIATPVARDQRTEPARAADEQSNDGHVPVVLPLSKGTPAAAKGDSPVVGPQVDGEPEKSITVADVPVSMARSTDTRPNDAVMPQNQEELPTNADVDHLVERFSRAYDAGELTSLMSLVDPSSARNDQMAVAIANFNRVFHETDYRHIVLSEMDRSAHGSLVTVRLDSRASVSSHSAAVRTDVGQLVLVIAKRAGVALIVDISYTKRA